MLTFVDTIITYHIIRVITGLPQIFHFLFKTNTYIIISNLLHQQLSWIKATSIACICSQRKPYRRAHPLEIDQIFLNRITNGRLITCLIEFYQVTPFHRTIGPYQYRALFIKREYNPITSQDS